MKLLSEYNDTTLRIIIVIFRKLSGFFFNLGRINVNLFCNLVISKYFSLQQTGSKSEKGDITARTAT